MSKLIDAAKKLSVKKIFAAVIALVIILTVFTSTVLANVPQQYNVNIVDSGKTLTVKTTETQAARVLSKAGVAVNQNDVIDISKFVEGKGGEIVINRLNAVNVEFESNIQKYGVYSSTVGDALKEIGVTINKKDKVNQSLKNKVRNGMLIKIKSADSVTLKADGKKVKYAISKGTVADLIKLSGIELSEHDYTEPALNKKLKANMTVKVNRVKYKKITKKEKIKYTTKTKKDKTLDETEKKVITKGKNGSKNVTYKVKIVNGKIKSKKAVEEEVIKEAVTEVVKVGTKKVDVKPNGVESKNGYTLGQVIQGRYTHYCACATCNGNSRGVTTSGKRIRNGMKNPYYIACNWLPLGSVIKVGGKNYTVVDRGGSGLSRRGRIDIFTPEGHSACYRYGTGSCKIEIVRLGW
jgi:uncharacterized protein YabE (DUF348 family)